MEKHEVEFVQKVIDDKESWARYYEAERHSVDIVRKRIEQILVKDLQYHGKITLETLMNTRSFPIDELVAILNISLFELDIAINQHNARIKEEGEGEADE